MAELHVESAFTPFNPIRSLVTLPPNPCAPEYSKPQDSNPQVSRNVRSQEIV